MSETMTTAPITTLFERLGGAVSIDVAVDRFYARILDDPELASFFDSVHMRKQRAHQKAFLAMALGGLADTPVGGSPKPTPISTSTTTTSTWWPVTSPRSSLAWESRRI
jgi:hemoglobin